MKKLKMLKLQELSKSELAKSSLKKLVGGSGVTYCDCSKVKDYNSSTYQG